MPLSHLKLTFQSPYFPLNLKAIARKWKDKTSTQDMVKSYGHGMVVQESITFKLKRNHEIIPGPCSSWCILQAEIILRTFGFLCSLKEQEKTNLGPIPNCR